MPPWIGRPRCIRACPHHQPLCLSTLRYTISSANHDLVLPKELRKLEHRKRLRQRHQPIWIGTVRPIKRQSSGVSWLKWQKRQAKSMLLTLSVTHATIWGLLRVLTLGQERHKETKFLTFAAKVESPSRWTVFPSVKLVALNSASMSWKEGLLPQFSNLTLPLKEDAWHPRPTRSWNLHRLSDQALNASTRKTWSILPSNSNQMRTLERQVKLQKADFGHTIMTLDFTKTNNLRSMRCAKPNLASDTSSRPSQLYLVLQWVWIASRPESKKVEPRVKAITSSAKRDKLLTKCLHRTSIHFLDSIRQPRTLRMPRKRRRAFARAANSTIQRSSKSKLSKVALWWMLTRAAPWRLKVALTTIARMSTRESTAEHLLMSQWKHATDSSIRAISSSSELCYRYYRPLYELCTHPIRFSTSFPTNLLYARTI